MILGIDPGKSGACVFINEDSHSIFRTFLNKEIIEEGPDDLVDTLIDEMSDLKIFIEKVHAMPGQGVTSMFNFGYADGFLKGIVKSVCSEYTLVTPQKWKKHFGLLKTTKDDARQFVLNHFMQKMLPVPDDLLKVGKGQAIADAYLIGLYGQLTSKE